MKQPYREYATIWQRFLLEVRCRMNHKSEAQKREVAGSFHGDLLYFNEEHLRELWQR